MGAVNMRGAGKADITVLVTLAVISRVTCLSLTSKLEADPGEVCYFLPLIPDPPH